MKRYAARVTAALVAFAAGISLAALPALFSGVSITFPYRWSQDLTDATLAAVAGIVCYVLVATGYREPRRDILFNLLFVIVGSLSLALCLWRLTMMFAFGGAEAFD